MAKNEIKTSQDAVILTEVARENIKNNPQQAAIDNRLGFLHGIASQVLQLTKEQLNLALNVDILLNKKFTRTYYIDAMLRGEQAIPELSNKLSSMIDQLNAQNKTLQKLHKELRKTAIMNPDISTVQKSEAEKVQEQLINKISALEAGNRDLLAKANEGKASVERPNTNAKKEDDRPKGPGRRA